MKRKTRVMIDNNEVSRTPHIIGYLRVSKERDSTGSFTFETQENRIRQSLDLKYGKGKYTLTFIQDDGLSGGLGMTPTGVQSKVRPSLQRIADIVRANECTGVIVYGQSRFFRNTRGLMEMVQDVLLPHGKVLLSATEDLDIETADGRMMLYMKGLFDEKQREDIIKRNKDAAASRAESGLPIGQVGYGWIWNPDQTSGGGQRRGIMCVEEEKHWLLHIKDRYLSGWNGIRIAGELNEMGVPTPMQRALWKSKAGKQRARDGRDPKWTTGTVWNTLCNPLHAGLIKCPNEERIKGQHWEQRFWDPEVLEQIEQAHSERNERFKTCTGQKNTPHLLNGLIFCARCGRRLYMTSTSESTKAYRSYKCMNGVKEGQPTCADVVVRAQWAEETVVEEIARLSREPLMRKMLEEEVRLGAGKQDDKLKAEKIQVKRKLDELQEKFERWADGFSKNIMSEKQFNLYSQKIEQEEAEATRRLDEIEKALAGKAGREMWLQQVQEQLENFSLAWDELDNDEKRTVLSLLLEEKRLTVDRVERDIRLWIKVHFLPEQERTLIYGTFRGVNRTKATGLQRLTLRHMVLLHYAGLGKDRKECAVLMGCKVPSIHTLEKTIRKNLGVGTLAEAVEMARERVEANLHQLPLGHAGRASAEVANEQEETPFISPVLMEVFELFAIGATVPEVAERLHLSVTTVQGRRARILKHFKTSSMLEAVEQAKELGILKG